MGPSGGEDLAAVLGLRTRPADPLAAITPGTYGHVLPGMQREAMDLRYSRN